jgi:hypothetical protein
LSAIVEKGDSKMTDKETIKAILAELHSVLDDALKILKDAQQ